MTQHDHETLAEQYIPSSSEQVRDQVALYEATAPARYSDKKKRKPGNWPNRGGHTSRNTALKQDGKSRSCSSNPRSPHPEVSTDNRHRPDLGDHP
jgi:hypothetical protein